MLSLSVHDLETVTLVHFGCTAEATGWATPGTRGYHVIYSNVKYFVCGANSNHRLAGQSAPVAVELGSNAGLLPTFDVAILDMFSSRTATLQRPLCQLELPGHAPAHLN